MKKIRLLRQLGISPETIKGIQQGTEDFNSTLSVHVRSLEQQIRSTDAAKDVCSAIFRANTSYAALDAEYYLQQLNRQENTAEKAQHPQ